VVLAVFWVSGALASERVPEVIDITVSAAPEVPAHPVTVPKAPKVRLHYEGQPHSSQAPQQQSGASNSSVRLDRSIGFSQRTPPDWGKKETGAVQKGAVQPGDVNGSKVSLYLRAPLMDEKAAVSALEKAGFTVLASYPLDKKRQRVSIVFTDDELQRAAAKSGRGFAASLRLLVDTKARQISIMNPLYVEKAFLQDDYDEAAAKRTLQKLRDVFKGVENSDDSLKYSLLPKYHFMDAMPYYQDMIEVGSGSDAALLAKVKASKKLVFVQPLPNGAVLVGVKLGRRTSKFVKKIGYHNAGLLPYPVLIEGGKAKILEPKYYIAVMYPQLSMSNFMTIATVPGAIEKECNKIFR